jgi:ABC-2 type transport system ATP-binding protein
MSEAISTRSLGKRYGRMWALQECSLDLPEGRVAALVGPNGAGKTTLLHLLVGLLRPTTGEMRILDTDATRRDAALLARIGFVAQDTPLYRSFSVADMLQFGRRMNPAFDEDAARDRLARLDIPFDRLCGQLSSGQEAQVALALALAKRPELLVLDEPVARLDPLARHDFLETLMEAVADTHVTVLLSSHLIADLERVCDHLLLIMNGRLRVTGDIEELLASHRLLTGPRIDDDTINGTYDVVEQRHTDRQSQLLVRGDAPITDPRWEITEVGSEELVLAYFRRKAAPSRLGARPEVTEATA